MTLSDDVLGFTEIVLERFALVSADLARFGLFSAVVTQREGVVTQRRDGVLSASLRQITRRRYYRKSS